MDPYTILASTGTAGTVLTILYFVYKAVNGKRFHSSCCGHDIDAEFEVDNMTPPEREKRVRFKVDNPIINIPK